MRVCCSMDYFDSIRREGLTTMRVMVDEEYGYRHWIWTPRSDNFDIVQKEFESVVGEENYYCRINPKLDFDGHWDEVEYDEWRDILHSEDWAAFAHIHTNTDSVITERKHTHNEFTNNHIQPIRRN